MKKLGKIVACGLALASVAGTYAEIAPHKEVLNADTQIEKIEQMAEFEVEGLVKQAKVGDFVTVPAAQNPNSTTTDTEVVASVKDFYGNDVNIESGKFEVTKACDYIVTYTETKTGATESYSKSFVIKVTGEEEAITFAENDANFIPSEMFKGQKLYLPAPSNEDVTSYKIYVNNSAEALTEKAGDNFVFVAGDAGSYSIRYEVTFENGNVINRTETLSVVNTNAYSVKVGHELASPMPTTAEAGQELTLPKVNTFNLNNNSDPLANYTKVEVKYYNKDGVASNVEVDGFKFTPAHLADGTSYYEVKYTINTVHSSFTNDEAEAITLTYQIRDVKDTKLEFEELNLKSTVKAGPVTFTPALKNEFDTNAEIKVTIKKRDKSELALGTDLIKNNDGSYTFTAVAGERYTIVLNGKDASGNEKTTSGFVVNAVSVDEASPEFKEDIVSDFVTANEGAKVGFVLPKAEDNIAQTLTYTVSVNNGAVSNFTYENSEGEAKTDLTASPLTAGDKVYFTMPSEDAIIKVVVSDGSKTSEKTYTVKLANSEAPTVLDSSLGLETTVQQGETIILPKFTVTDANIFATQMNLELTIDGKDYTDSIFGSVSKTYKNATTMEVSGYKFVAATAGDAVLYVTVVDADNNFVVKAYKFTIASTSNAVMSIGKMPTEVEVYEKTALPTPEFKDGTERVWHVVAVGEEIPAHQIIEEGGKRYFIAEKPGTFVLEYVVFDVNFDIETRSVAYTITAKDSKAPMFTLDNNVAVPSILPFAAGQESAEIFLPGFKSVSDSDSLNNVKSYKLTVKDTDSETYTVEFDNKGNVTSSNATILSYDKAANKFKLKVNQIGTYTFEYTVVDLNGNTTTIDTAKHVNGEMKLVVGDIYAPTMDDSKLNIKRVYKEGETFVANIKDLVLDDNITEFGTALEEYKDKNLTVSLYNGSTQVDIVVDSKTGDITLKEGGALEVGENYRLVLNLKDEAGKVSPLTYNISVKAKEAKAVSHEKVWGIVLICVSVAVLGAVVVYFVATRDKKAPAKFAKKEEEKVEAKPENEEN